MNVYVNNINPKIFIYSQDEEEIGFLENIFKPEECDIVSCNQKDIFIKEIKKVFPNVIILCSHILEALDSLSEADYLAEIPVIGIIKPEEKNNVAHYFKGGMDEFIIKPVFPEELLNRIKVLINLKHSQEKILEIEKEKMELSIFREDIMRIMVHDIGNCISGIVGSMDLLRMESASLSDRQRKNINRAEESVKELLQIIKNMSDINKKDGSSGRYPLYKVDISAIMAQLKHSFTSFCTYNKRQLIIEDFDNLPPIKGNEELVTRVMEGLLSNAIKSTSMGKKITVTTRIKSENNCMEIIIKDQGKTLPKEYRKKIFNLYGQLEIFDAGYRIGKGFSLSFCKSGIEIMGGQIWMEELENESGNSFVISLPLAG